MDISAIVVALIALVGTLGSAYILTRNRQPLSEPEAIIESKDRKIKAIQADLELCREQLDEARGV